MNNADSALFRAPVFKRIDDPWIGLLVLAVVTLVASVIAMIVLCVLWRRYQKRSKFANESYILSNQPTGQRYISDQTRAEQSNGYETQNMEVFVPQNYDERYHERFPPQENQQQVHQFYERTTKEYF